MLSHCLRILFFYGVVTKIAYAHSDSGFGILAGQALESVSFFYNILGTISFALGILFLMAAVVRYIDHRKNPLRAPIGTVIFLLISGSILITLPFLSLVVEHGLPFFMISLFNTGN